MEGKANIPKPKRGQVLPANCGVNLTPFKTCNLPAPISPLLGHSRFTVTRHSQENAMFRTNVAAIERPVRFALGAAIAAYAVFGLAQPSIVLAAMGACVALTGLVGFCPACAIMGRQIRPKE